MVDPAAPVLVPEGDRVDDRVVNSVEDLVVNLVVMPVLNPVDIQWVALPVIAGPAMAVQVGRTTPGVRVQVKLGQADKMDRADKVVSPVSRADIQSGKWSVPNRCQDKRAAAPIRMVVVVPVVVDAIVGVGQTQAEGPAVRAIGNVSRVNFRGKRQRVDLRSNLGPRVSRARRVFRARQVFRGRRVERAHQGHRVSQAPHVIRMLRVRLTLPTPLVHPARPAHPVRRGPLGFPVLHASRDFRVTMAQ